MPVCVCVCEVLIVFVCFCTIFTALRKWVDFKAISILERRERLKRICNVVAGTSQRVYDVGLHLLAAEFPAGGPDAVCSLLGYVRSVLISRVDETYTVISINTHITYVFEQQQRRNNSGQIRV